MKVHRYKLRPGLTEYPQTFPNGQSSAPLYEKWDISLSFELEDRRQNLDIKDPDFDLKLFIVLDEECGQPYVPFYHWINGKEMNVNNEQEEIIQRYNELLDNLNWLIRDEEKEKEIVDIKNNTVYQLNQQIYDKEMPLNSDELEKKKQKLLTFFTKQKSEYYMLLCKELSDYTVFHKTTLYPYQFTISKIIEVLQNRGPILDLYYNTNNNYIECWVRYREDQTPHMYILFEAQDFIIKC